MSAPLVVNTRDGVCWTRRTVTSSGIALYAPEGVCSCPEFVMATLPELAEHGIVGSADVLPVPVGPVLRSELDQAHDDVVGACLARWESEQENERLRWALASAKRGRARLRAQVAALLEERRSTNEALDDAVQELRARQAPCPCPPENPPAPHQLGCPQAEVPVVGPSVEESADRLTASFAPVAALREDEPLKGRARLDASAAAAAEATHWKRLGMEDPHDGPLAHPYRVGHDLPELGGAL